MTNKSSTSAVQRSTILGNREVALKAIKAVYTLTGSRDKTGKLLGITGSSVTELLTRTGNQVNPIGRPNSTLTPSKLVDSYWAQGKSLREIGAELCLPHTMIHSAMVKYGIPRR